MDNSISECDSDICEIAQNIDFKADNIKNIKDQVFYNELYLDRFLDLTDKPSKRKSFKVTFEQALTWKRLESRTHTPNWLVN